MKKISKEEIKYIAKLANLSISEKEADLYSEQLGNVLGYVEELSKADTSDVSEIKTSDIKNVFREDLVCVDNSLSQEEVMNKSINVKNGLFKTKAVLDKNK